MKKEGWLKYWTKGAIVGRLPGFGKTRLWFVLDESCAFYGYKDEGAVLEGKIETEFFIKDSAIMISQDAKNQFEVIGDSQHLIFSVESEEDDVLSWVSSIQNTRSFIQGVSPKPDKHNKFITPNKVTVGKRNGDEQEEGLLTPTVISNGVHVEDHPLAIATTPTKPRFRAKLPSAASVGLEEYEWDSEATSMASPWVRNESLDENSAVFNLSKELADANKELEKCRTRIKSYQEVLAARDRQLFDLQDKQNLGASSVQKTEAYLNMEEQARSYQAQNALLNEEVLKLHQMCNKARNYAREQKRIATELQTELFHFQRDYVSVLGQSVRRPLVDPPRDSHWIVTEKEKHLSNLNDLTRFMKAENDHLLGCSIPTVGQTEHVDAFHFVHQLPNKVVQIEYTCRKLTEAYDVLLDNTHDNHANLDKWKHFISSNTEEFEPSPHLCKLILNGVPQQYRAYIWQKLIDYYTRDLRRSAGETYYYDLLKHQDIMKLDKQFTKNIKQIGMDVTRTMPSNRNFGSSDSTLRERLSRVLTAFCVHSPRIGYCQGFNFLVGGCLLFLEEEDAFWFLVAVTECIFPADYYSNGLAGLLADQKVLQTIVAEKCPRLNEHFSRFPEFDLATITTSWFLALFFDCLPFQTMIRVWDCFLAHGHEALFRVSCAIFRIFEDRLLELNEPSMLLHATKNIPKFCFQPEQLIQEAFAGFSNFPTSLDYEESRIQFEKELIDEHETMMKQRKEYEEKMFMINKSDETSFERRDDEWVYDSYSCNYDRTVLCASCELAEASQVFQADITKQTITEILMQQITSRIMCCLLVADDILLVGLLTGQLQAYSISQSFIRWSMSLSNVVLSIEANEENIFVGTADGKLHIMKVAFDMGKPSLVDSIDLSKASTTCLTMVPSQSAVWVASGPAVYVLNTESLETEGFFLISARLDQVQMMLSCAFSPKEFVLITTRGSPVLQLRDVTNYNMSPILVYDTQKDLSLPLLSLMMPDDSKPKTRKYSPYSITAVVLVEDNTLWVGTAKGDIKMYQLLPYQEEPPEPVTSDEIQDPLRCSEPEGSMPAEGKPDYEMKLVKTIDVSSKPIRSLIINKVDDLVYIVSCSGGHDSDESVKCFSQAGDFVCSLSTQPSHGNSEPNLDVLSRSLSFPTLSVTQRDERGDDHDQTSLRSMGSAKSNDALGDDPSSDDSTAWKSSLKNVAASAMKTYRDKKPGFKKFMSYLGTNSNS